MKLALGKMEIEVKIESSLEKEKDFILKLIGYCIYDIKNKINDKLALKEIIIVRDKKSSANGTYNYNSQSINVSYIHYRDDNSERLNAISFIITIYHEIVHAAINQYYKDNEKICSKYKGFVLDLLNEFNAHYYAYKFAIDMYSGKFNFKDYIKSIYEAGMEKLENEEFYTNYAQYCSTKGTVLALNLIEEREFKEFKNKFRIIDEKFLINKDRIIESNLLEIIEEEIAEE